MNKATITRQVTFFCDQQTRRAATGTTVHVLRRRSNGTYDVRIPHTQFEMNVYAATLAF